MVIKDNVGIVILVKVWNRVKFFLLMKLLYPLHNLIYETCHTDYSLLTASVNPVSNNWGDDVSIKLCELINSHKKFIIRRYTWNIYGREDYLVIGSIITWMTTPKSIIWGSGIVYPHKELSAIPKKVLAVRGPLTRQYLIERGVSCPEIYGDPALLFPRYYKPKGNKKYKLGVIPHFRDKGNVLLEKFRNDEDILIIDVQKVRPWTKIIDDVCRCEYIASSSLHGIIISDAYNVPNVWIEFADGERKQFAFQDYFCSVDKASQRATPVNNTTTKEILIKQCENWKPIKIDLDLLLSVCPFITNDASNEKSSF